MLHSSMSWETTLLYFFSWNYTWFGQKESINVQNFGLLTARVEFNLIGFLIGFFCWKCIKFRLNNWRGVMSHDTEDWSKIWRKTDLWFWISHFSNLHQSTWKCENYDYPRLAMNEGQTLLRQGKLYLFYIRFEKTKWFWLTYF